MSANDSDARDERRLQTTRAAWAIAFEAYREQYRDLSDKWKLLETKAQGTIAIAGIFVAAAGGFLRESMPAMGLIEKTLLMVAVALLFMSVVFAMCALWIRGVVSLPGGNDIRAIVELMATLSLDDDYPERLPGLMRDQSTLWERTIESLAPVVASKSRWVLRAQMILMSAILLITIVFVTLIV